MKRGTKRVEGLARGLKVLKAIHARPGVSLHELHSRTGIAKATLLRALRTLEDEGFIGRRIADGGYLPALRASRTPRASGRWLPLTEAAGPSLEALSRDVAWPTDLGVRDGTTMLVLESNRRLAAIRVDRAALGKRPHMLWSALGRAYLAFAPAAERDEILAALQASTLPEDRPARDRAWVDKLLKHTRDRGYGIRDQRYAVHDREWGRRISAIAVPVRQGNAVLACVNCVWLNDVLSEQDMIARHLPTLQAAAAEIAARAAAAA